MNYAISLLKRELAKIEDLQRITLSLSKDEHYADKKEAHEMLYKSYALEAESLKRAISMLRD